ncbi:MAG: DUF2335 domain-containing protein [Actinobacteria bacterium]|nr:DUF2335 domain-containing protein [Actinomycetota bacterium]
MTSEGPSPSGPDEEPETGLAPQSPPPGLGGPTWVASLEAIRSPLPPPAVLREYERLVPGCTERFLVMTETESNHRREMESLVVRANVRVRSRGQIFAFIIVITAVVGGIVLIALGKGTQGLVALVGALGALATTFLIVRRQAGNRAPNGNGNGV